MEPTDELILFIERAGKPDTTFAPALERKDFQVEVVDTGQAALELVRKGSPDLVVLNAASLGSNGMRICKRLQKDLKKIPLIHIFAEDDAAHTVSSEANVTLVLPFTPRKLINRVKRLLPGQRKDAVQVGPIRFSPGVRIVEAHGREKRLTPRTAALLEIFLNNPGEVLDRKYLMREVWQTDYVGDTRTLDVHVRWVREAVELQPAKPRLLVTVRRVGYRFDPDPPSHKDGTKS